MTTYLYFFWTGFSGAEAPAVTEAHIWRARRR